MYKDYNKDRNCLDKSSLCHAPNYSMHFAQNGVVSACSFTRFMPMGKFPEQTIDEIWFGNVAQKHRKQMKTRSFPEGCKVCSSDFHSKNYGQMRSKLYDIYGKTYINRTQSKLTNKISIGKFIEYPQVISFELSNTCNLECVMCIGLLSSSIRKNREKLPPIPQRYNKDFINQLKSYIPHLKEAKFFGGEPFLIDLYLDIWDLFIELNPGCKIYITTNGTIFNNRVKRVLEKLVNLQLVVSLDSITKDTYEKIRVNAQFERVIEHVFQFRDIVKKNDRYVIISPTYMTHNWAEYPSILDFANRENLLFETNILTTPHDLSLANFSPEQLKEVLHRWMKHPITPNNNIGEQNQKEFDKALTQVEFMYQDQSILYSDRMGRAASDFPATNLMETVLTLQIKQAIRSTVDPSLPLKLRILFSNPTSLFSDFYLSISSIAEFMNGPDSGFNQQLYKKLESRYTSGEQTEIIKNLLRKKDGVFHLLSAFEKKDEENFLHLFEQHNFTTPIEQEASEFFY
ncbi:radical SAM protein [Crocinitomicaceae bacterium CZZ-1]|uniref:Radical SAM protein n=1 Tax=Taishania pollutisoli TaxID=2766479 RepID=A0A8J6P442_9FLAO|nr:radical SAM protein [Taishania pollutisoli]MBC9811117.1 radical SAM protein [Taishania pollutisoli]MBX2947967.1 radical SAM protein [Crocinitomicaceae bacterium]NGF76783.1 radical SAM protein [Fluviicola sp. SGL-29]